MTTNSEALEAQAHLAFCALVALGFAHQEGRIASVLDEHLFLLRWLTTAQKQKRFSRLVAPEIAWLIARGRQLGLRSDLNERIQYLYQSCQHPVGEQPDLFRLTYVIEALKAAGWSYYVLSPEEWRLGDVPHYVRGRNILMTEKVQIDNAFNDAGDQLTPLEIRVIGNREVIGCLLQEQRYYTYQDLDVRTYHRLFISISASLLDGGASA